MKDKNKIRINITLDKELLKELNEERSLVPLSAYINEILKKRFVE